MHKVQEGCPGCGACISVCPVEAITIDGLSAVISNKCIDCGVCSYSCQIKLIKQEPQSGEATAKQHAEEQQENKKDAIKKMRSAGIKQDGEINTMDERNGES